jgi:hypothetical protein
MVALVHMQAGLAGLAFDEGTFGVFAYVTEVSVQQVYMTRPAHVTCTAVAARLLGRSLCPVCMGMLPFRQMATHSTHERTEVPTAALNAATQPAG